MADTVRLRNIGGVPLHIPVLNHRLVAADEVVEIPARLLHHQAACTGIDREYVPAEGAWADRECPGCLQWPEQTWQVETTKTKTAKE
jgi:hypothetical protein